MSEYVDKSDVLWIMRHAFDSYDEIRKVEELPPADVAEVRHGHWIPKIVKDEDFSDITWIDRYTCSECGSQVQILDNTPYCPHCGTKMDEEEQEHE